MPNPLKESAAYRCAYYVRRSLRRTRRFLAHGAPYFSFADWRRQCCSCGKDKTRKLLWIGEFPAIHSNVGDHAQTLAVEQFLAKEFPDHQVTRLHRREVNQERLHALRKGMNQEDCVLIHSSGDFGSKHYKPSGSWHRTRRRILPIFQGLRIINLPATVYYPEGDPLRPDDADAFDQENFTLLCREPVSLATAQEVLRCDCQFFPDFVFYLQRPEAQTKRSGVLVLLRSDAEAALPPEARKALLENLRKVYSKVDDRDILKAKFPVLRSTHRKYLAAIQDTFEQYELVVTDRMHGMILAVTTNTPCLALNGGIPHKITAYEAFLSEAVEFAGDRPVDVDRLRALQQRTFQSPDLSGHYAGFRKNLLESDRG